MKEIAEDFQIEIKSKAVETMKNSLVRGSFVKIKAYFLEFFKEAVDEMKGYEYGKKFGI